MNRHIRMMMQLLGSEVCQSAIDETLFSEISEDDLKILYQLSSSHDLAHIVGSALSKKKWLPTGTEIAEKFQKQVLLSIFRYEKIKFVYSSLYKTLAEEQISFVPLKGSVIREYYPEPRMRTSCDIDILVKYEDLERTSNILLEKLHYRAYGKTAHDVSFWASNGILVELHYDLVEDSRANQASAVLRNVWDYTTPKRDSKHHFEMTDEMFYFYHIAHMAKHFETGGCGVKPFLDLWILEHRIEHSDKSRNQLLEKGNLLTFSNVCQHLSEVWFGDAETDTLSQQMQVFILTGGVYGNQENWVSVQRGKNGGKIKSLIARVFLPYSVMKYHFPVLQKHRYLLPFAYIVRMIKPIFDGHLKRYLREWELNRNMSKEESNQTQTFLKNIGL